MSSKILLNINKESNLPYILLIIFTIVISLIEFIGISAIIPFINIITNNSIIYTNKYLYYTYNKFNFSSKESYIIVFGILLVLYFLLRGILNIIHQYLTAKYAFGQYNKVADKLFTRYINLKYQAFRSLTTSTINRSIVNEAINSSQYDISLLTITSEIFIVLLLYSLLLYFNFKVTIFITIFFGLLIFFLFKYISKKTKEASKIRSMSIKNIYNIISNTLFNFKIIKTISVEQSLHNRFINHINAIARAYTLTRTLNNMPRLFLETLGFSVIIIFFLYILYFNKGDISYAITFISVYVVALYRMLPSFTRILSNYNTLQFNSRSKEIIKAELIRPVELLGNQDISFNLSIVTNNVYFFYSKNKPILKKVNMHIKKGDKVGIIGESGIGKSTLLDILMGFLRPTEGKILIDNVELCEKNLKSWRTKIGYIPQHIYLLNDTIQNNILFGRELDINKLDLVAKQTRISHLIRCNNSIVGESGLKLSGGERQRVAIARALYGNPEVIIMDEATSALDFDIENKILEDLFRECFDKTIFIVTHRINTIKKCNKNYRIIDAKVVLI